jgi:hypothetical protein
MNRPLTFTRPNVLALRAERGRRHRFDAGQAHAIGKGMCTRGSPAPVRPKLSCLCLPLPGASQCLCGGGRSRVL